MTAPADPSGHRRRIAIVVARFNEFVTSRLRDGARDALRKHGVGDEDVVELWVPGAFEIPVVARALARSGGVDAIVCLGAVIRGETPHFAYVAGECARGIADVARDTGVPATFGVLTTETAEQARERAGGKLGNKGWDAAVAALDVAATLASVRER
jgi:6,7-dimethyl-8-ribityllumazine synthase